MSASVDAYQLHVISHTHWDREWYFSHENFRLRLVDLLDHLIGIMESDPEFKFFQLDGQTIVLEDYLEIRPAMRERLQKLISDGRILIGPWYLQNDEYLTDGESTIRNLLIGFRQCRRDWGVEPMMVGYIPDQFGNISQMPQILQGFEIPYAVYGRGSEGPNKKPEFTWRSPDGSEVFAVHLFQWYNNAQRLPRNPEHAVQMCREIVTAQRDRAQTGHLLLMNGVDHLEAQENLGDVITETNAIADGFELIHDTLPHYLEIVRAELPNPAVHEGEMRAGDEGAVLSGTASSRVHLKLANFACQQTLRRWVEPFAVFARACGSDYACEDVLDYAWKTLIQNHPHDSICGCSIDEVHFQMEARFRRVQDVMADQLRRSFRYLTAAVDAGDRDPHSVVNVFNAHPWMQSGVIESTLDLGERESSLADFHLIDAAGNPVEFVILDAQRLAMRVVNPKRLPKQLAVVRYRVLIEARDVPGVGYKALFLMQKKKRAGKGVQYTKLKPANVGDEDAGTAASDELTIRMTGSWEDEAASPEIVPVRGDTPIPWKKKRGKNARFKGQQIAEADVTLANDYLSVKFRGNGSFDMTLANGRKYEGLHVLEDVGDRGNEYIFMRPKNDTERTTEYIDAEVEIVEHNALRQQVRVTYKWKLPPEVDDRNESRPGKLVDYVVRSTFTLSKGAKHLDVRTILHNNIKDHRLRVLFPTRLKTDKCFADAPFDMVQRSFDLKQSNRNNQHPLESMVTVTDGRHGLAVFSAGAPEYEVMNQESTIALTLLRCVDLLGDIPPEGYAKEQCISDYTPGAQCQREYEFRYGIYPYDGVADPGHIKQECERFVHPMRTFQLPVDRKSWEGFRPGAPRFFDYFEDDASRLPEPEVKLAAEVSLLSVVGDVNLSTVKFPEARDRGGDAGSVHNGRQSAVIRLVNYTGSAQNVRLETGLHLESVDLLRMSEEPINAIEITEKKSVEIEITAKQVLTLSLQLQS
ncbi:MAG: alpha-mannosidase [Candidatus Sumerlaeaceae bacterium]